MKKILLLLVIITALASCEAVQSFINYFVDIEPNKTAGTENTEFLFKANTNDIIDQWIIDGAVIPADQSRSAKNKLHYSFSSGNHIIEVLTVNGATDEIEISVSAVETIFKLSALTGEATTEFYLDYPLLTIEGIEYNIESMGNNDFVTISDTEEQRIISLNITVDFEDSFSFINNNAFEVHEIDLQNMSATDLIKMITIFFPERYLPPEPEMPFYSETRFSLSGYSGLVSDHLTVFEDKLQTGIDYQLYVDHAAYMDDIRKIVLTMYRDNKDSFLFVNGNMLNFFNIDMQNMSYSELIIAADILNRYPEEGLLDLVAVYNP